MSFDLSQLQENLERLKAVHDAPAVVFTYRGMKVHLRDLDAEEDALANEYSYSEVEAAARKNNGPDQRNFSRSMAASFKYQIAYVALAIRAIEQKDQKWDVDVRPDATILVKGKKVGKFGYFVDLVGQWGSSIPNMIYEYLSDVRAKREKEVAESLNAPVPDEPPDLTSTGDRFKEVAKTRPETPLTPEEEAAAEETRLAALRKQQGVR